jgi:5-methyltetrahydrofolate--homocysteine methyltransferase
MKKSVAVLEPYLKGREASPQSAGEAPSKRGAGRIVLATVKGDVHDIGKNIVGVVLACNNYEIIDLGVMVPAEKILSAAREAKADIIGLSGLITPSLDEMVHVAKEMERQHFTTPLLIGGATTSRAHTAVKISPAYSGNVVHVLDASRSVTVASSLLSAENRQSFAEKTKRDYDEVRAKHNGGKSTRQLTPIAEARRKKFPVDWKNYNPTQPSFLGNKVLREFPLEKLRDRIDWSPFFATWELNGKYPAIFDDKVVGGEARKLFDDANTLLEEIVKNKLLKANAAFGFYAANTVNDDDVILRAPLNSSGAVTFHFLRQQVDKSARNQFWCLADFLPPRSSDDRAMQDAHLGAFAVTAGIGLETLVEKFERQHDDYNAILAKALADRLAEAFAETLHELVRREYWGYAKGENLSNDQLINEEYQGIRPAPGYPACPDHSEKQKLFDLLEADRIGITLTSSFAMYPAASVSGFYFAHPQARYFGVGRIARDQMEDYAARKQESIEAVERWLRPYLDYEAMEV